MDAYLVERIFARFLFVCSTLHLIPMVTANLHDSEDPIAVFNASVLSSTAVELHWSYPNRSDIKAFVIYWRETNKLRVRSTQIKFPQSTHIISTLKPYRQYELHGGFKIDRTLTKNSDKIIIRTFGDKPNKPPSNIKINFVSPTEILVAWRAPPLSARNGNITEYKIQYRSRGSRKGDICTVTTSGTSYYYILTDLLQHTVYRVRIAAKTMNGTGKVSRWKVIKPLRRRPDKKKQRITIPPTTTTSTTTTPAPLEIRVKSFLATHVSATTIDLNWKIVSIENINRASYNVAAYEMKGNCTVYTIKFKSCASDPMVFHDVVAQTNARIPNLKPSTTYYFILKITSRTHSGNLALGKDTTEITTNSFEVPNISWIENATVYERTPTAILKCDVTGDPKPFVTWFRVSATNSSNWVERPDDQTELSFENETYVQSLLYINKPSLSDSGLYACSGENYKGNIYRFLKLTVKEIIEPELTPVSSTLLHVQVLPGRESKDYRLRITDIIDIDYKPIKFYYTFQNASEIVVGGVSEDSYYTLYIDVLNPGYYGYDVHQQHIMNVMMPPRNIPLAPKEVVVWSYNSSSLAMRWNPPPRSYYSYVRHYIIDIRKAFTKDNMQLITDSNLTSFVMEGLLNDISFDIRLKAVFKSNVSSLFSPWQRTKTLKVGEISAIHDSLASPPDKVRDFRAYPVSPTSVQLSWRAPLLGNVVGYNIKHHRATGNITTVRSEQIFGGDRQYKFLVDKLRPYELYDFSLTASDPEAESEASVLQAKTFSDVPDSAPLNFNVTVLNSTTAVLEWSPPPPESRNGEIEGYKIVFVKISSIKRRIRRRTDGPANKKIITGLIPGKTYLFRVAAMTVNGTGPFTDWADATTEPIAIPKLPSTPMFTGISVTKKSITLTWAPAKNDDAEINGFIVGYGRYVPEVYRVVLGGTFYVITNLKPSTEYIISVRAYNKFGESSPAYETVETSSGKKLGKKLLTSPSISLVHVLSPTSVHIRWYDGGLGLKQRIKDKRYYIVKYHKEGSSFSHYKNFTDLIGFVDDLRPYTTYTFSVKTVLGQKESHWSVNLSNKTFVAEPDDPPKNLTILPVGDDGNVVRVRWNPPDYINGPLIGYILHYTFTKNFESGARWSAADVIGNKTHHDISIKRHKKSTWYFKMKAWNTQGYGPMSETVIYKPPTEVIKIPGAPEITDYNVTSRSIFIRWTDTVSQFDKGFYLLKYRSSQQSTQWDKHYIIANNFYQLDGLASNTEYSISLTAFNDHAESPEISLVLNTSLPDANEKDKFMPPLSPNITKTVVTPHSIDVSWTDTISYIEGGLYRFEYRRTDEPPQNVKQYTLSVNKFYIHYLDPDTEYEINIQAFNRYGESDVLSISLKTKAAENDHDTTDAKVDVNAGRNFSENDATTQEHGRETEITAKSPTTVSSSTGTVNDWSVTVFDTTTSPTTTKKKPKGKLQKQKQGAQLIDIIVIERKPHLLTIQVIPSVELKKQGILGYQVAYAKHNNGDEISTFSGMININKPFTMNGLAANSTYQTYVTVFTYDSVAHEGPAKYFTTAVGSKSRTNSLKAFITNKSKHSISVRWEQPEDVERELNVMGYQIMYEEVGSSGHGNIINVPGHQRRYKIDGLEVSSKYRISVSPFNDRGTLGQKVVLTASTKQ